MQASTNPLLYQINTRVWLTQLSQTLGRPATLDDLPDTALDAIGAQGFEWIYFLGVWQTGLAARNLSRSRPEWLAEYQKALPDLSEDDICGSPFAITGYTAHALLGGDPALQRLHQRLQKRGLRLMLDFVPNHTAPDHLWVWQNPDYYVNGSLDDLDSQPDNYVEVETSAGLKILARGRDPYYPGWPDTLQLNYANPGLQQAMKVELVKIARLCDGLRCDMAMLVLPEIFERTWGASIPAFWPSAIAGTREVHPGFVFMAEVYWDLEAALLEQGFDYAYDKQLYDSLLAGDTQQLKQHLRAPSRLQRCLARFLENHDEARAAATFSEDKHKAAAVVTFLAPGLRFFHQGQLEGFQTKISVHLCRGPVETPNPGLAKFYTRLLDSLKQAALQQEGWQLLTAQPAWEGNPSHESFIAYAWRTPDANRLLSIVNYAPNPGQATLPLPFIELAGKDVRLTDCLGPFRYDRQGDGLISTGLYLDLPAWGYHLFELDIFDRLI
jgi:hypothetical protein